MKLPSTEISIDTGVHLSFARAGRSNNQKGMV